MFSSLLERLKAWIVEIVKSRAFVLLLVFCILSGILVHRVFNLQIVKGQDYLDDYKLKIQKTKEVQGTRGRILDRNGVVLADNKLAYSVTIEDNGDYSETKEKNQILNETISEVIAIVESNGDSIINDFKIIINDSGEYEYSTGSETQRLRFLADIFGYTTIDKLSEEEEAYTASDMIDFLCGEKKYGIDQDALSKEMVLKMVNIRYALSLNRYQKYVATTIASDVSEETTAAIMENQDRLQGVNIEEDSLRYYTDSKYFANIIGYTGQISQAEYDALDDDVKENYSLTDIIGKSGLEQVMDEQLQGEKGEIKLYVNNVGKVIETNSVKESRAGNDLYLTIDAELQKFIYDSLEEKLAGILLDKMSNVYNYDRSSLTSDDDVIIPIDEVYYTFFGNELLDMGHFAEEDAKTTEKAVYEKFVARKESALREVQNILQNKNGESYEDTSKEMQAYLYYVVSNLLTSNSEVLVKDEIDKNDDIYLAWNEGTINVYEYLNYAVSKNWIDTSKLKSYMGESGTYSDSNETYQALVEFICVELSKDSAFDKIIYKYMIKNQKITGREVCLLLFEQEVIAYDESQYERVKSGSVTAYDFIRAKIETLELTPGQLGLEPCTASAVVIDPNTGDVLACVSYPGYDNNKLANSMDSSYYSYLINHSSSPLYNNATQEKTAPGSTYKPLVAIAGLTEGVISNGTTIACDGIYDTLSPATKCFIYPGSHGSLDVVQALRHSCNEYFCEVGFRLGLLSSAYYGSSSEEAVANYSDEKGLDSLEKYATLFGLNEKSGIEIPESSPQISDTDATRSSIGQGTNNYATVQIARYITAVANKGTVYDLTLLEHTEDVNGKVVENYGSEIVREITEVSDYTWSAVQAGMRAVISNGSIYDSLGDFELSGKTGTAQQSTSHADHGLFVGYAPSSDPEIAFAIRIKNGYTSQYVAEVGRDITRYYFNLADRDELVSGSAGTATQESGYID